MNSMQRVLTALGHQEPDRVPLILTVTMHGAKELGMTLAEYYSSARNVAEGQQRLQRRYGHDCLYSFFYGPVELEDLGAEIIRREDGPFTSGNPIIARREQIAEFEFLPIDNAPRLQAVLETTRLLKSYAGDEIPILGVVISPFSLPVMQMGFGAYFDLIFDDPDLWRTLMSKNMAFAEAWANAQFAAGATAIVYFDPVSSPTILSRDVFLRTGFGVAEAVIARLNGPAGIHLASARVLPILDDLVRAGAVVVSSSAEEDLGAAKEAARNRVALLGNLNGITMRNWTPDQAALAVKKAIAQAGRGGGFLLGDLHGEIPLQVPDTVLEAVAQTNGRWGNYPLDWIEANQ